MAALNVGIIGQGRSGRGIHGNYLITDPEYFRIAAVVDPLEDRRQRAVAEYQCDAYADYHALFQRKDLDLVVNATPSHLHVPITREFLDAGYNVLCEKPLAKRAAEVDRLIAAAERSGRGAGNLPAVALCPLLPEDAGSDRLGRAGAYRPEISSFWNGYGGAGTGRRCRSITAAAC